MNRDEMLALAERVSRIGDITCPMCGEEGFDIPGFVLSHQHWCEVQNACLRVMASRDSDVVYALRARAAQLGQEGEG